MDEKGPEADRIHTTDARALNYFLTRSEDFSKLDQSRRNLARTLGNGLLVVNGEDHRTLRLDLPIRELTSIFVDKSIILRDKWTTTIAQSGSAARIDVLGELNQVTLDSELNRALQRPASSTAGQGFSFIVIAKTYFPILKFIPDRMSNRSSRVQAIMRRVGMQLLAKKAERLSDGGAKGGTSYLDCVVRESLRVHAPVPRTERIAIHDVAVPLDTPFKDVHGNLQHTLKVLKGCFVNIPILAIHRSKTVWGEDALEFKPERWERPPEAASSTPGVWSHLFTFLGGAHACIGYRFSLVETKAFLFVLVRAFEYKLAVPAEEIVLSQIIVQRPMLRGALHEGGQMPLLVSPYVCAWAQRAWELWFPGVDPEIFS
ncbi:cytochrome P450 [Trametes meyenii]|nr:cytochrome P450 [Trametes meyenii]